MNVADRAKLEELLYRRDRTPKDDQKLDRLVAKLRHESYANLTSPEGIRRLIAVEALEEAEVADEWAKREAASAVQSISLLSSRERKRAREWVTSDRSPWGTEKHGPIPSTITRAVAHQRKATR